MSASRPSPASQTPAEALCRRALDALQGRTLVLVGLMGVGKSSIGKRLATRLGLPFTDSDLEVEAAAGQSIPEIFEHLGEEAFRDGERRVIARLLGEPQQVLAVGGGAFMSEDTRAAMKARAVTLWLKADLELILRRVGRRANRPLIAKGDPRAILAALSAERDPVYALADLSVESQDAPFEATVDAILAALADMPRPARRADAGTGANPTEAVGSEVS